MQFIPPGEISLMHQHIVQRLAERIRQRYFIILRRRIQPPAHHLLQQTSVGVPVGQRIVQQRQSFVRELGATWQSGFLPLPVQSRVYVVASPPAIAGNRYRILPAAPVFAPALPEEPSRFATVVG